MEWVKIFLGFTAAATGLPLLISVLNSRSEPHGTASRNIWSDTSTSILSRYRKEIAMVVFGISVIALLLINIIA